jgi:hypothetical protein
MSINYEATPYVPFILLLLLLFLAYILLSILLSFGKMTQPHISGTLCGSH